MKGAVRFLLTRLQARYPNALIICITPWKTGGNQNSVGFYCDDYGKAMLSVCESMSIPCINAMDSKNIGVDMTDAAFRTRYCMKPSDVSHLNIKGMKLVLPAFERHIAEFYLQKPENPTPPEKEFDDWTQRY